MRLWDLEEAAAWEPDAEIFVRHPDVADRAGYRTTELMQDSYAAVLPAGHRLAGRERIGLEDLRGEVWVDNDYTRGPNRKILMQACAGVGLAPDFRIETQDYAAAVACVEAGVGITVMPQLSWQTVAGMVSGVQALPLDEPGLHRVLAVRTRRRRTALPPSDASLSCCRPESASSLRQRGYIAIPMYLVSRNSSMPVSPPSRPSPDSLIPPKGAAGLETAPD